MNKNKHSLAPDWPAPANIHAATTLRTGGVSCGVYTSLNTAMHVGDNPENVQQNRQIIKTMLGLPSDPVWLEQTHSDRAVMAEKNSTLAKADASYTDEAGVVCAVMTADCLPLLICSADGSRVGAIHAGWRGLLAGIIGNTVKAFGQQELMVWLGPAIGPDCFEVGAEVRDAFVHKASDNGNAFIPKKNGKWLANIYQLAENELLALGITKVYGGLFCTATEHQHFFSYRREAVTGRMTTLIWRD